MSLFKSILVLVVVSFLTFEGKSQSEFQLEASSGWIYTDLLTNIIDDHYGYNTQFDLTLWKTSNYVFDRLIPRAGIGYSYMWALVSSSRLNTHYLTLKTGSDYEINDNFRVTANLSSYIVLNGESERFVVSKREQGVFLNLDLGIRYKIGRRIDFVITGPLTLTPTYRENSIRLLTGPNANQGASVWTGMLGLNVGFHYRFGRRAWHSTRGTNMIFQ